jgi:GAF domain-containing protein
MSQEADPRWKLLAVVEERLADARTPTEIIEIVRSTARAVVSCDGVTFVMRDGGQCHYVEEYAIGPLWKGQRFPLEMCISGWAMLHGETAAIEDIFADPRIPHDAYRKTFVKSLVMAPAGKTNPTAAVGAYWGHRHTPSEREISAVEEMADAVGRAMKRVS